MYRIQIDYSLGQALGATHYGQNDDTGLSSLAIPSTGQFFYCLLRIPVISLPANNLVLSPDIDILYFPHYAESSLIERDIFFRLKDGGIAFIDDTCMAPFLGRSFVDLRPRNVSFVSLEVSENPACCEFDSDYIQRPHHQLFGTPYFIQDEFCLLCPSCQKRMEFVLQFDEDDELDLSFGDSGSAYYWWCGYCSILGCRVQSC